MNRKVTSSRLTQETQIECVLDLEGSSEVQVATGIGFLDHLLTSLAYHARFDLKLQVQGDLQVGDHHIAEDCGIILGEALDRALGERKGIARFGWALVPMDEALARAAVDLASRPFSAIKLGLKRESIGGLSTENAAHLLGSFATSAKICLHLEVLCGNNDHHRAEAAYKAVALALRCALEKAGDYVPSTKGVL